MFGFNPLRSLRHAFTSGTIGSFVGERSDKGEGKERWMIDWQEKRDGGWEPWRGLVFFLTFVS